MAQCALVWCRDVAGRRVHGTTRCIPLEIFEAEERTALIPLQPERFVVPHWGRCKVHPDHHVRFDSALYSVPTQYVGREVDVRSDGSLVRIYFGAELIKSVPTENLICVFRSIAATDSEMNPAAYSDVNPATYSDVIPATFWRVPGSNRNSKLNIQQSGAGH
jgi:Mu transposase, C-terminal domain